MFNDKVDSVLPILLFGLLKHEQKMSVLHLSVQKFSKFKEPIKSKDELIAQIGFRSFTCNPIFSEHNPKTDKHRFERFLPDQGFSVASIYAPITFLPSPVLLFRKKSATELELVALGSNLGVNPDRIVLKRIILTGHPFKVQKTRAVVRYMFYNAQDVNWFKPVELWTHSGLHGVIREPVGTHGYMKCRFDRPLKGFDRVCMSLYKRAYPKWTTKLRSILIAPRAKSIVIPGGAAAASPFNEEENMEEN